MPLKGLQRPYGMAFLPDGSMLITERAGRLRIVSSNVLDAADRRHSSVLDRNLKGLNDIALHPDFARNGMIYFTYYKPAPDRRMRPGDAGAGPVRRRQAFTDVADIFTTSQAINQPSASRIVFGRDGKIYFGIGVPIPARRRRPGDDHRRAGPGQPLREGAPVERRRDGRGHNPFAGNSRYKPEIFALGIRNAMGLAVHPETGEIWETENGPQGGDELNIIRAGKNYGWPTISYGRSHSGDITGTTGPDSDPPVRTGLEQPLLFWAPSIALSGLTFYTGDRFPEWKGSIFVGGLVGTQLQRIVMNQRGLPIRRDMLL